MAGNKVTVLARFKVKVGMEKQLRQAQRTCVLVQRELENSIV